MHPQLPQNKFKTISLLLLSLVLYGTAIYLIKADPNHLSYRWHAFFTWIGAIFTFTSAFLNFKSLKPGFSRSAFITLLGIILFCVGWRLFVIDIYPFPSVGDSLRDGGLAAMEILNGKLKGIFGWGSYNAHGAIIPVIGTIPYSIFGSSPLAFRSLAVFLSTLSVVGVYLLLNKFSDKKSALWAALTLSVLPYHLFFGRLYIVGSFSFFFTPIIIGVLAFFAGIKRQPHHAALVGIIFGFALGMHAAVRALIFIAIVLSILIIIYDLKNRVKTQAIKSFLLFFTGLAVGFGPRILFTPLEILFRNARMGKFTVDEQGISQLDSLIFAVSKIGTNYIKAIKVYGILPTGPNLYNIEEPMLPLFCFVFFIFGLVYLLINFNNKDHKAFNRIMLFLAFALPFTNSAILESPNVDNRLTPLIVVGAIISGMGISHFLKLLCSFQPRKLFVLLSTLVTFTYLFYLLWCGIYFFTNQLAAYTRLPKRTGTYQDYLLTYSLYAIKEVNKSSPIQQICFSGSKEFTHYLGVQHILQQFSFYIDDIKVTANTLEDSSKETDIFLSIDCPSNLEEINNNPDKWHRTSICDPKKLFFCPPDGTNFSISISDELNEVKGQLQQIILRQQ